MEPPTPLHPITAEDLQVRTPGLSLLLAYAAMLPIAAGTVTALAVDPGASGAVERMTVAWAGAVLCFLAGIRRGLSFRQASGPAPAQLGTMLWLFLLGALALASPWRVAALVLLLVGYASMVVLDPAAARRQEVPRYFAQLRPAQMLIPILSLLILLARDI